MRDFLLRDPHGGLAHIFKIAGTSNYQGSAKRRQDSPVYGRILEVSKRLSCSAFVHHLSDLFISAWKMVTEATRNQPNWSPSGDSFPPTLEQFAKIISNNLILFNQRLRHFKPKIRHHIAPQTHPSYNLFDLYFVGLFKCLERDFVQAANYIGLQASLPHLHATAHGGWEGYLWGPLLERCQTFYADDFREPSY